MDHARLDSIGEVAGAIHVLAEDRGREAVLGVVGQFDGLPSSENGITGATGPKCSLHAVGMSFVQSERTVGSTNRPSAPLPVFEEWHPA